MRRTIPLLAKWFQNNLSFECTKCGKCCKGNTRVFVNSSESFEISEHLHIDEEEFLNTYTYTTTVNDQPVTSLKSKADKKECIFLDTKNRCSIYEVRPTQCRTYPFWPKHMISHHDWSSESLRCEGMDRVLGKKSDGDPRPFLSDNTVLSNMVIHAIHDGGRGPAWTYDEAKEMLDESEKVNPLITDYSQEFFSTHFSTTVYETNSLRVIDTTIPGNSDRNISEHDGFEMHHGKLSTSTQRDIDEAPSEAGAAAEAAAGAVKRGTTYAVNPESVTLRRLEFKHPPGVVQNECEVYADRVNFQSITLQVHRVMASVAQVYFESIYGHDGNSAEAKSSSSEGSNSGPSVGSGSLDPKNQSKKMTSDHSSISMCVLGAGGCVLPNQLLHLLSHSHSGTASSPDKFIGDNVIESMPSIRPILIDCVERESEALEVAEAYFDANFLPAATISGFGSRGLVKHCTDATLFLQRRLDAVMLQSMRFSSHGGHSAPTGSSRDNPFEYDVIFVDLHDNGRQNGSSDAGHQEEEENERETEPVNEAIARMMEDGETVEINAENIDQMLGHAKTLPRIDGSGSRTRTGRKRAGAASSSSSNEANRLTSHDIEHEVVDTDTFYPEGEAPVGTDVESASAIKKVKTPRNAPLGLRKHYLFKRSTFKTKWSRIVRRSGQRRLPGHHWPRPRKGPGSSLNSHENVISFTPSIPFVQQIDYVFGCLKESSGIAIINVYGDVAHMRKIYALLEKETNSSQYPPPIIFAVDLHSDDKVIDRLQLHKISLSEASTGWQRGDDSSNNFVFLLSQNTVVHDLFAT